MNNNNIYGAIFLYDSLCTIGFYKLYWIYLHKSGQETFFHLLAIFFLYFSFIIPITQSPSSCLNTAIHFPSLSLFSVFKQNFSFLVQLWNVSCDNKLLDFSKKLSYVTSSFISKKNYWLWMKFDLKYLIYFWLDWGH